MGDGGIGDGVIALTLAEIARAVGAETPGSEPVGSATGVSTDSRSISAGELFFALRGPNFDGHEYIGDAMARGACGAVVAASRVGSLRGLQTDRPLIVVDDPLMALGELARFHRRMLPADVIAVVGSNGKTTTKAMIDHVLSADRRGRASFKSFNNSIGVPLTLLSATRTDEYLVVEIGTNAPGEVAALAAIAEPNIAVVVSIGEEHLEKLGDLRGVAREECAVFSAVRPGGFAAVNIDCDAAREFLPDDGPTVVTFGYDERADLRVTRAAYRDGWLSFELNGKFAYRLPAPGVHNASNAAAAVAVARRFGLGHEAIAQRLESFAVPPMRGQIQVVGGVTFINDAYNANPPSVLAAVQTLETFPSGSGKRYFVLGEMRELGAQSRAAHRRVVERLGASRIDHVLLVGAAVDHVGGSDATLFGPRIETCAGVEACAAELSRRLRPGDVVLVKASRAVALDRLLSMVQPAAEPAPVA